MATTSKLEMSLDEIIKANKLKDAKAKTQIGKKFGTRGGIGGVRKGQTFKKRAISTPKQIGGKKPFGRQRFGGPQQGKGKFGTPKGRTVGVVRRKPIVVGRKRVSGGIGIGARKNALRNRAVMNAAENLVKKLVKKALTQPAPAVKGGIRAKFQRTRVIPASNLLMNKISPRSRVIARRQRIVAAAPQQPPVIIQRQRGRGPIRYVTDAPVTFVTPRRKFVPRRNVRFIQQQQQPTSTMFMQPQQPIVMATPQFNSNTSVRDHINAMRRANTLQQLQAQFVAQSQPPMIIRPQQQQQFVLQPVRQQRPRRQRRVPQQQQQFVIQQQRPVRFQQQFVSRQQQQIFVAQQQYRRPQRQQQWQQQQFVVRQQFAAGRRPRQQGQQQQPQIVMDPSYVPPNFLQRI